MIEKEKYSLVFAEFFGTVLLASVVLMVGNLFGLGTASWYTALSAGLTLSLIIGLFGHISGAHVNPAVTIGLWTMRKIPTANAIVYIAAQLLGGSIALIMYNYFTGDAKSAADSAAFSWNIFWAEVIGATIFGMGIAAVFVQNLKGSYAAFLIGASLAFGAIVASTASAGFLNPAVALAFNDWNKTLVIAPIIGLVIGMNVYSYIFTLEKTTKVTIKSKK